MFDVETLNDIDKNRDELLSFEEAVNEIVTIALCEYMFSDREYDIIPLIKAIEPTIKSTNIGRKEREKFIEKALKIEGITKRAKTNDKKLKELDKLTSKKIKEVRKIAVNTLNDYKDKFVKDERILFKKPPKFNVNDYPDLTDAKKIAKFFAKENVRQEFVQDNKIVYFVRKDGSRENFDAWYERNARWSYAEQFDDDRVQIMKKNNYDLVIVSSHPDSSSLCIKFQGKIYSQFGKTKGYPLLEKVIYLNRSDGLGLRHYNCRHQIDIYDPFLSNEPVEYDHEKAEKLYQKRQDERKRKRKMINESIKQRKEVEFDTFTQI